MPPNIVFSKEQIINTAFEIFREEGINGISVRKLAVRLNSSTAPIYTSFKNIEEIKELLLEKSLKLLLTYTQQKYTSHVFLNIGVGMLEFARDYKIIYKTLFMENSDNQHILKEFNRENLIQMKKEKGLLIFEEQDLKIMIDKLCVYTHGLAAFLCAGMLEDDSKEDFINELQEMGGYVIGAIAFNKGLIDKYCMGTGERGL